MVILTVFVFDLKWKMILPLRLLELPTRSRLLHTVRTSSLSHGDVVFARSSRRRRWSLLREENGTLDFACWSLEAENENCREGQPYVC
ncbi:hypothetical protein L1049_022204 [Liquidambar formosana]|uniref:Uncharacterized protein n=1 Tax=Liquidambar formosana TaxID=63359 RepID=A0AAP0RE49_LIQFO